MPASDDVERKQAVVEAAKAAADPGLDGRELNVEYFCDLRIGVALVEVQYDGLALKAVLTPSNTERRRSQTSGRFRSTPAYTPATGPGPLHSALDSRRRGAMAGAAVFAVVFVATALAAAASCSSRSEPLPGRPRVRRPRPRPPASRCLSYCQLLLYGGWPRKSGMPSMCRQYSANFAGRPSPGAFSASSRA